MIVNESIDRENSTVAFDRLETSKEVCKFFFFDENKFFSLAARTDNTRFFLKYHWIDRD